MPGRELRALAALLLISSGVIRQVSSRYVSRMPPEEELNTAQVQELLEGWDAAAGGWPALGRQLEELGYQLHVARGETEVYSSLDAFQRDLLQHSGAYTSWPEGQAVDLWTGTALMVGIQSGPYTIISIGRPDVPELFGRQRPPLEAMLVALLVIGVAGISHDLRTPLTSVKGYLKGLRDGVANTPEKREQYLGIAYRKACDMDVLLQKLFYFSRLETGSLPLLLERADLGRFVRDFVRDAAGELEQRGGRFVLRGSPPPHPVRMDAEQMMRVLNNLTDNAVRYAGAEPLVLTLTVWRDRAWEKLRFADNGRGVPEEQLPHLFEQFWRGDQSRSGKNGEGSGLGLYIVQYILEAHGGTVTAWNDGGLVFELALPCEEESGHA